MGIYDISEEYERERIKAILIIRATKLGCESVFKSVIKSLDEANKKLNNNKFYQNYTELNFICKPLRCDGWEVNESGIRCLADSRFVSSTPFVPVALLKNINDTEGINKGRMKGDELQPLKSWHCAFILSGEEPCTKTNSGGGAKNRVIEIETTQPLIEPGQGNETVNFVTEHYGHAGKSFAEYVADKKDLKSEFSEIFKTVQANSRSTEKQISSMALMLFADKLACECIFKDERPLNIEECCSFLSSSEDVDISERAYRFIVNHIAANKNRFFNDVNMELWGSYKPGASSLLYNKQNLEKHLSAEGFAFDAVKKDWVKKGYIKLNNQSRYFFSTSCHGMHGQYVKIMLPTEDDELPFESFDADKNNPIF